MLHRDRIRSFTAKEAFLNLLRLSKQLEPLLDKEQEHKILISYICSTKEENRPALKAVSEATGLKPHVLRKQLKELYFLVLEKEELLRFDKVEYKLHYKFNKKYYELRLNKLPVLPNVGDNFETHFIEGIIGVGIFTVQNISHSLEKDKQVVDIILGE